MRIVIPSKGRSKEIQKDTISLFAGLGIDIDIFVGEEDQEDYKKHTNGVNIIPKGRDGITKTRNAILDYYKKGDEIIMCDDDIKSIYKLTTNEQGKKKSKKMSSVEIKEMIEFGFYMCKNLGYKHWGIYPINNCLCMSDRFSTKAFIIGTFSGIIVGNLRYDERLKLKEDYDFTLQHIYKHGGALRLNSYSVSAKHYTNPGGCVDYRSQDKEKEAIDILNKKWGNAIRENKKRENEILINLR